MKGIFAILGLVAAAIAGYKAEPSMRYQLTGHLPKPPESKPAAALPPLPPPAQPVAPVTPAPAPTLALDSLTPAQLPAQVTLKVAVEVADASGLKMKIDAGARLRLVRLEGDSLVVSPGTSPFEGRVPVAGTDLMEQLAANPPAAVPAPVPTPDPVPVPDPVPTPDPVPVPDPVPPVVTPDPAPAEVTPAPADVTPAPAPDVAPAPPPAGGADVVAVMKKHISEGHIKEFAFNQVKGWKAEADEVIEGETYQIGLVRYNAETIFGSKLIEAKALIKNGEVVRWVWPKSGMEIK